MIDIMSADEVLTELKNKQLPTYGTNVERKERLKKAHGINPSNGNRDHSYDDIPM
jgi:hypothetical protein